MRVLLLLLVGMSIASSQRFRAFPARYKLCDGPSRGLMDIKNVTISAFLANKSPCTNRHLLVTGRKVEVCVEGVLPNTPAATFPIQNGAGLKNSAHGTLVPLPPQDFCNIVTDACTNADPPCSQMVAGGPARLCSVLTVPNDAVVRVTQPDVTVRWKTLMERNNFNSACETSFEVRRGQVPLVCIELEAKVVTKNKCPGGLLG